MAEGVVRDKTETSGSLTDTNTFIQRCVCVWVMNSSLTLWLKKNQTPRAHLPSSGALNISPLPLKSAPYLQVSEEVKVLIIYLCVLYFWFTFCVCLSWMLVRMSCSKSVVMSHSLHTTTITPTYPGATGGKMDRSPSVSFYTSCLVAGVSSSLWPHPPSPPQPLSQCGSGYSLAALSGAPPTPFFFFFFLQQGASQRCGVLHACPVFLLAPLLATWSRWSGVSLRPLLASSLSVQLTLIAWSYCFELTWMLLFGFGACGSFFLFNISLFFWFRKHVF